MAEWENEDKDAHPAGPAEKEILIFSKLNLMSFIPRAASSGAISSKK